MKFTIVLKSDADHQAFAAHCRSEGIALEKVDGLQRHYIADRKVEHETVLVCEEDQDLSGDLQPLTIDTSFNGGWHLARVIRRRPAWDVTRLVPPYSTHFESLRDGSGVDVYLLDSGVDLAVAQMSGRVTNVWEGISSGGAGDDQGHGTSCASLAIGGESGIARNAALFSFKTLDSSNSTTTSRAITGLGQILTHYNGRSNPAVCSISIGGDGTSASLAAAYSDLIDAGMVICNSAGNDKVDLGAIDSLYAEADPDVIVCGGLMPDDGVYLTGKFGTNWGARVDVLAPAYLTETAHATAVGGGATDKRLFSGTSASCPIVAGIVACLLQGQAKLTTRTEVQAVRSHVINTASTGYVKTHPVIPTIADRIAYLDPRASSETIPGL